MTLQPLTQEDRDLIHKLLTQEASHVRQLLSNQDICSWHIAGAMETLERMRNRVLALERGSL